MRLAIYSIFAILTLSLSAQTVQQGVVKEYNEKAQKTPLAGVEFNVRSAGSTVSDQKGEFSLNFLTLKAGDHINVRNIQKAGYEIFNKEALEQWNLNPSTPFMVVMCRSDKFKQIRDNYERQASANYKRQYDNELSKLNTLKNEGKIKEEEYRRRLEEIQENYDRQLDNLDNYIDRFSRIDLSELSEIEQQIIALVQEGKFDEAIERYESQNYVKQYCDEVEELRHVSEAIDKLQDLKESKEATKEQLLAAIERHIDILELAGGSENIDKIENIFKAINDADPQNIEMLIKASDFYAEFKVDLDKCFDILTQALNATSTMTEEDKQPYLAVIYSKMGSVYGDKADFKTSLGYYEKSIDLRKQLYGEESLEVATDYNNIGTIYGSIGDTDTAMTYYENALHIRRSLFGENSEEEVQILINMGSCLSSLGKFDEALEYYFLAKDIAEKTSVDSPISIFNNIGQIYYKTADFDKALDYYNKALEYASNKYGEEHTTTATILTNIGSLYSNLGKYEDAKRAETKALQIYTKLLGDKHSKVSMLINNLATISYKEGNFDEALENFQKSLLIDKDIPVG